MSRPAFVSRNGELIPPGEASVSVFNPAIYGAYGVYESMQVTDGVVFEPDAHLRRLAHSAAILESTAACRPPQRSAVGSTRSCSSQTFPTARSVCLWSGRTTAARPSAFIWAQPPTRYPAGYYSDGVTTVTFEAHRYLPQAKSFNSLASFMAQRHARAADVHEALLYHNGSVTEGSNSNLFAVMDGEVLTPPESEVLVGRHARNRDLAGAGERYPLRETALPVDEMAEWDECFITSTSRHVMPVTAVDGAAGRRRERWAGCHAATRLVRGVFAAFAQGGAKPVAG